MDNVANKIPSNVKNAVSSNINMINQNTKKYREMFIKLIKENKIIVFIIILILFFSLVSYRFAPKPREWIVKRTISKHMAAQVNIKSVYSYLQKWVSLKDGHIKHEFWDDSDAAKPQKKLHFTLSDFHIASSAKTYLLLSKYYDYCSYDSIMYTIDAGARFIELDIFRQGLNEDQNIPVVTNGIEVGEWKMCINTLCLDQCMKIIHDMAFNTNNSPAHNNPFILYLNIHINAELTFDDEHRMGEKYGDYRFYNKIADILYKNLSKHVLGAEYSWYNQKQQNKNIHLENIFNFKNRLIIMSNVSANCSNLAEFINIVCPQNFKHNDYIDNMNSFTNSELEGIYDVKGLRLKNKNSLTHVYEHSDKNGLKNYVSGNAIKDGCQLVSMYYQVNDNNFYNYMNNKWGQLKGQGYSFNECSFLLKRKSLRNSHDQINKLTKFTISAARGLLKNKKHTSPLCAS